MEETTTSWKNHSFTLLVFGGIVVLCSIFFVLGMLVGRNQGQRMAENSADKEKNKPVAVARADDLTLNFPETTGDKPKLDLQPAPPEPPTAEPASSEAAAPAVGGASSSARLDKPAPKQAPKPINTSSTSSTTKVTPPKKDPAKTAAPASAKDMYLQVFATKDEKQAKAELKKVQSKGLPAMIMEGTVKNERFHRVVVGPYKESDLPMATSDLKAKGYKEVLPR